MVIPSRRTLLVLATLVGAMTIVAVLLLILEPLGSAGPNTGLSLRALSPGAPGAAGSPGNLGWPGMQVETRDRPLEYDAAAREPAIFAAVEVPPAAWDAIAIHFSGAPAGSMQSVTQDHLIRGLPSLAHHIVIGNGSGSGDGQVDVSDRWRQQAPGLTYGLGTAEGRRAPIDICLIGDGSTAPPTETQMQQLVATVCQLQQRFHIPAGRVLLYSDANTGRGRLFPTGWFRQQLLVER